MDERDPFRRAVNDELIEQAIRIQTRIAEAGAAAVLKGMSG